jgi:hypothetical protein
MKAIGRQLPSITDANETMSVLPMLQGQETG